jgi:hypothetical protein
MHLLQGCSKPFIATDLPKYNVILRGTFEIFEIWCCNQQLMKEVFIDKAILENQCSQL